MNSVYARLLYAAAIILISAKGQAQNLALKAPKNPIIIDGDSKEWGDSLVYYNAEKDIHYTIANDKDNLYLVVKTNDIQQQNSILLSGVTFSIDPKGRKKPVYSITFPLKGSINTNSDANTLEGKREIASSTRLKKIAAKGFKDINEDQLNTDNAYKIHTALNFDDEGYLVYEEAIPLTLFHADGLANNEWSYNIKLNAVVVSVSANGQTSPKPGSVTSVVTAVRGSDLQAYEAMRSSSSPRPSYGAPPDIEVSKASDFWGNFKLAQ
jgi:hypothetical protein